MGKKLLVADDSATIQKVIKLALSAEGYDISGASSGQEAVDAIKKAHPDVVLIDVTLPELDAYAVKRAINESPGLQNVKFILMYSAFEKVNEAAAKEVVVHGRLIKPFDPSDLRKMVASLTVSNVSEQSPPPQEPTPVPPPFEKNTGSIDIDSGNFSQTIDIDLPAPERTKFTEKYQPVDLDLTEEPAAQEPPIELPVSQEPAQADEDIQGLADSTYELAGIDAQSWSVDESRKLKSPKEKSSLINIASVKSELNVRGKSIPVEIEAEDLPLPVIPTAAPVAPPKFDDGGSQFLRRPPVVPTPSVAAISGESKISLSRSEMEEIIKREVSEIVNKIVRESVPRLAEEMLRKEIDRILSEQ